MIAEEVANLECNQIRKIPPFSQRTESVYWVKIVIVDERYIHPNVNHSKKQPLQLIPLSLQPRLKGYAEKKRKKVQFHDLYIDAHHFSPEAARDPRVGAKYVQGSRETSIKKLTECVKWL